MDYTLPNGNGNAYDFGDPEYWESYGAESHAALVFVRGFPEYWRDVAGWYSNENRQELVAKDWRRDHFLDLTSSDLGFFTKEGLGLQELPFKEKHLRQFVSNKSAKCNQRLATQNGYESGSIHSRNVSCGPFTYILDDFFDGDKEIPVEVWSAVARTYVDALRSAKISPKPLPSGLKERERLSDGTQHVGRMRLGHQVVLEAATEFQPPHASLRWGPLLYPLQSALKRHLLVVGMPRSGKTSLLRLLIQSLHREKKTRCIVYDFKTELVPWLKPSSKHPITHHYHLLNPYDARGSAWDIAKDVDDDSTETLASILIGMEQSGADKYFLRIPRSILSAVIRALMAKAGDKWTFLDLMLAIQSENIRSVLATTSEGRRIYNANIKGGGESGTQQNVISELNDCSQRYVRIAAAWSKTSEKISLREWALNDSKGIILGNNFRNSASIKPIIQAIIHFLFIELLDDTHSKPLHTFMVLDEFARLGPLPLLTDVMEASLSQGLSLALGVHDLNTVKSVYGVSATAILGACGFRAYLRNENPDTASWVSSQFGDQDVITEQESSSRSESESLAADENEETRRTHGVSISSTKHRISRPAVQTESIKQLPLADRYSGVAGYFAGPDHPPYQGTLDGEVYQSTSWNNDEDGENVYTYYLWNHQTSECESKFVANLPELFSPPEDTFSTLEALGFKYDPDPHSIPLPVTRRKVAPDVDVNDNSASSDEVATRADESPVVDYDIGKVPAAKRDTSKSSRKNPPLSDCVWDDEFETYRLKTDHD